jgi:hypothetical protein
VVTKKANLLWFSILKGTGWSMGRHWPSFRSEKTALPMVALFASVERRVMEGGWSSNEGGETSGVEEPGVIGVKVLSRAAIKGLNDWKSRLITLPVVVRETHRIKAMALVIVYGFILIDALV